jgi:hypothetical protein
LVDGIKKAYKHQTLLGATGTGKTFVVSHHTTTIISPRPTCPGTTCTSKKRPTSTKRSPASAWPPRPRCSPAKT